MRIVGWGLWLKLMLFNGIWCAYTTFTPFSHPELYLSSVALSITLLLPALLLRSRTTGFVLLAHPINQGEIL